MGQVDEQQPGCGEASHYSRKRWRAPSDEIIRDVAKRVATLLDELLSRPCFTDLCHWRDALPAETAGAVQLNSIARGETR